MKPNQVVLSLESIANDKKVRVINVNKLFEFENNVKTDKEIGFTYECLAENNGFEKFSVKVSDLKPVISQEELANAAKPVYLTFSDFIGKFYWSSRTNAWELSAKSSAATIVNAQK